MPLCIPRWLDWLVQLCNVWCDGCVVTLNTDSRVESWAEWNLYVCYGRNEGVKEGGNSVDVKATIGVALNNIKLSKFPIDQRNACDCVSCNWHDLSRS